MTFLRNCWYAVAWASEIDHKPMGRTILGEDVTFYRKENGDSVGLASRCPHRFAPLYFGDLVGDNIRCPYHALQFSPNGKCVDNPHTKGSTPPPLYVKTYSVVEKNALIWIWMGEDSVEPIGSPTDEYYYLDALGEWVNSRGYMHTTCNYHLITDNLLDHAHATHLHSDSLASDALTAAKTKVHREGSIVHADRWAPDGAASAFFAAMFENGTENVDHWVNNRWEAPAMISIDAGVTGVGREWDEGIRFRTAHIVTPETETSSHYFWSTARNFRLEDDALTQQITATLDHIFTTEDKWMLEGQQKMMKGSDFWSLRPSLLAVDEAAVTVRRVLDKMIAEQVSI